jgi:tetraacyldisaccharide 4'-kinase
MPASEPSWWYGPRDSRPARWLRPASHVYGALVERRMVGQSPYVASRPVICVGNFTAGGTGKTPLTQTLVAMLTASSGRPAVLSRGYGGRLRGPHWVDGSRDTAGAVGDEPLLLAAHAPVMVARDRAAGARAIEADTRGFSHIVMDDGLQNPALAKSLTFAVVDGTRGLGNGEVIPAGPLRAALAFQMSRVDAVVVNRGFTRGDEVNAVAMDFATRFDGPVLEATVAPTFDVQSLGGAPCVAFAGIGVPARFFEMLRALGVDVREAIAFKDHYAFTERDARRLLDLADTHAAVLLTTEKDRARLAGHDGARLDLRARAKAVPIQMAFADRDRLRLEALLAPLAMPR